MSPACSSCRFENPPGMRFCGNCGVQLSEPVTDSLSPHAAAPIYNETNPNRVQQSSLDTAEQRRDITVLFADLSGYSRLSDHLDSEDVYEILQQVLGIMVRSVFQYEGSIDTYTGDGIQAIFGAPITNENNAEMAVRAALDMQLEVRKLSQRLKPLTGFDLDIHVGLHSGSVIVGPINDNKVMDFTAVGSTVNLARQLEEAAPASCIFVTEPIYKQTLPLFEFQPAPTDIILREIDIPIYQVIGHKQTPGRTRGVEGLQAPMIGRQAELQMLNDAMDHLVTEGVGKFMLVRGEAGIGKSRLLIEFEKNLKSAPIKIFEAQNQTFQQSVPYGAFLEIIYRYLEVNHGTPEEEIRYALIRRLDTVFGKRANEISLLFEHLLGLSPNPSPGAERLKYLEPGQLRQQIFIACRDLLLAESQLQPVLLIIEDLHWADHTSVELIQFLLSVVQEAPVLFITVSRPVEDRSIETMIQWARDNLGSSFQPIHLKMLSQEESEHLLSSLLSMSEIPPKLRKQILERAAGIPFYLEEILRMLLDKGYLERENSHFRTIGEVDLPSLGVPSSIQSLVLARFDKLENVEKRILQIAAVLGQPFSLPLLRAILSTAEITHPWDEFSLVMSFSMLMDREFLVAVQSSQERLFTFRHILMQEAIMSTLLKSDQSQLHGEIAEAMTSFYADRLDEKVELLADHYLLSDRHDQALKFSILAGGKAAAEYANQEARRYFENSLSLFEHTKHTPEQALQIHSGLGDVLALVGEYQVARRHYHEALQAIAGNDIGFSQHKSILLRKIGSICIRQGEYEQALSYLALAQTTLENLGENFRVERAQALNEIGFVYMRRSEIEKAEENLKSALSLLAHTPRYDVIASIYNRLGGIYFINNELTQARSYVQKSLALREELGDLTGVARSYNNLGLIEWKSGKWESALYNFSQSVRLNKNLGDVEANSEVNGNLGLLYLDYGDLNAARTHLEQALLLANKIHHPYLIGIGHLYLSRLFLVEKKWDEALQACEESLLILHELGDQDHEIEVCINKGTAYAGLKDAVQAQKYGEIALKLIDEAGANAPEENHGRALRLLGKVNSQLGQYAEAHRLLNDSAHIFANGDNQLEQGRTALTLADLFIRQGAHTEARMMLNEARLIFRHLGAKLDLLDLDILSEKAAQ